MNLLLQGELHIVWMKITAVDWRMDQELTYSWWIFQGQHTGVWCHKNICEIVKQHLHIDRQIKPPIHLIFAEEFNGKLQKSSVFLNKGAIYWCTWIFSWGGTGARFDRKIAVMF